MAYKIGNKSFFLMKYRDIPPGIDNGHSWDACPAVQNGIELKKYPMSVTIFEKVVYDTWQEIERGRIVDRNGDVVKTMKSIGVRTPREVRISIIADLTIVR